MKYQSADEQYRKYLDSLPLMTLRTIGREMGVPQSASRLKDNLIEMLVGILTGAIQPAPRTNRGARPKQTYVDPSIYQALDEIRKSVHPQKMVIQVKSDGVEDCDYNLAVATGIFESEGDGSGYLRVRNFLPSEKDVYLSPDLVRENALRTGDRIAVTVSSRITERLTAVRVLSINEREISQCVQRPPFEMLTACYPTERIALGGARQSFVRMADTFLPLGKGQRAFVMTGRRGGANSFLRAYAQAYAECNYGADMVYLLLNQSPESLPGLTRSALGNAVVATSFEEQSATHIRAATLVFEHAKRLVEEGKYVVVLLDSLNALVRAFRHQTADGKLSDSAYTQIKRMLGSARNTQEGGAFTLIASVCREGEDAALCRELSELGNAQIVLSGSGEVDFERSFVLNGGMAQSDEEMAILRYVKENSLTYAQICDLFEKYPNNQALFSAITK